MIRWVFASLQYTLQLHWRHNGHDSVSNHQPHDCLLNRLFRRRSKKISTLRVTGLCAGNSPATGEFPAQMTSNAENVSIWWRHHGIVLKLARSLKCLCEYKFWSKLFSRHCRIICYIGLFHHVARLNYNRTGLSMIHSRVLLQHGPP